MLGIPQMSQLAQDQCGHAAREQSQPRPAIPCRGTLESQSPPKSGQGRGPRQGTGAQSLNLRPACIFL